jgi:hypothetical protein
MTVHVGSHFGSPIWLRCMYTEDALHGFAAARRGSARTGGIPASAAVAWETDGSSLFCFALRMAPG